MDSEKGTYGMNRLRVRMDCEITCHYGVIVTSEHGGMTVSAVLQDGGSIDGCFFSWIVVLILDDKIGMNEAAYVLLRRVNLLSEEQHGMWSNVSCLTTC